ncbi:hypothetical protein [Demequina rhizosphaerae]|uniref:hypothetical protein n=1 Tax=Demequina rhizosphaerae TaxID=1638985 RepID=UPI000781586F|nr:hypothetical protein [Demequina rhizosphaerae]
MHHLRTPALSLAALTLCCAGVLAGCTGEPDAATPSASSSDVPVTSPTATETAATATAEPTASATPEPTRTAAEPQVVTTDDELDLVVGSASNGFGTTDPESVFEQTYGGLGEGDGVEVSHSTGTTSSGAPLLIVEVVPAEGNGGDSTLTFYALWDDAVVQGSMSRPDGMSDDDRDAFEARAIAAVHP